MATDRKLGSDETARRASYDGDLYKQGVAKLKAAGMRTGGGRWSYDYEKQETVNVSDAVPRRKK